MRRQVTTVGGREVLAGLVSVPGLSPELTCLATRTSTSYKMMQHSAANIHNDA